MDEFAMRALEHLKKLVSIPSASGNENEVAEYCYRTVEAAGFRAEKIPTDDGRFVVYAGTRTRTPRSSKPSAARSGSTASARAT